MKERTIRLIAVAHKPLGRIVSVLRVADDDYLASIEDRRDRASTCSRQRKIETWLDSRSRGVA